MKRINSFTRIAVLLVCTFIMQGLFLGRAAEVKATPPSNKICHDGSDNEDGGRTSAIDCADPVCASYCSPPNIVLIVADDMGWGDVCKNYSGGVGCSNNNRVFCDPFAANKQCNSDDDCNTNPMLNGCRNVTSNTPHLDTLADNGVRLTNFYSPTPVCSPARGALLTGKHPLRHGGIDNQNYPFIQGTEKTLAEALKEVNSSYSTAVIGKWHIGWDETKKPQNQGFDYSYVLPTGLGNTVQFCLVEYGLLNVVSGLPQREYTYYNDDYVSQSNQGSIDTRIYDAQCPLYNGSNKLNIKNYWSTGSVAYDYTAGGQAHYKSLTRVMTDKAIQFITNEEDHYRQQSNAPFFLYLAYPSPHVPLELHVPDYPPPHNLTSLVAYERSIREISDNVGSILDCLRGNNGSTCTGCNNGAHCSAGVCAGSTTTCTPTPDISDNTIVIFTSDNGPWLGFHLENTEGHPTASTGGLKGGKQFTFEGGIRVPFIARWPNGYPSNITSPRTPPQSADLMDIFTTLLAAAYAANGQIPSLSTSIDGKDLTPVLSGNGSIDKTIHSFSPFAMKYPDDTISNSAYQYAIQDFCASNQCASSSNYYKLFYTTSSTDIVCAPAGSAAGCVSPINCFGPDQPNSCWPYFPGNNFYKKEFYYLPYKSQINGNEKEDKPIGYLDITSDFANKLLQKASVFHTEAVSDYTDGKNYIYSYYFPSVKDGLNYGWENNLSVQAKDVVNMDVKIRVYDMGGTLIGTSEETKFPYQRVQNRPCWIVGGYPNCPNVEGSMIVETSVPAIASTNTIANNYKGLDIYEAAKPRSMHFFGKNFDGPNNYQVYILIQNIYDTPINVTIKLIAKNSSGVSGPGDGATRTVDIDPHATYKVRPSDIAGGINFNGSVVVYSNRFAPEDGLWLPIPAMNRQEAGTEALTIYESSVPQKSPLAFPHIRDGKFGGTLDYQNYLSVVNPSSTNANLTIVLYNNAGTEEGRLAYTLSPNGKETWRPSWIKGTLAAPRDFEGSIVITSDIPVISQTNVLYPGTNAYGVDAFNIYDSAIPSGRLFFPKIYDNLKAKDLFQKDHLFDNYVYIQNPEETTKTITVIQYRNNGTLACSHTVTLGRYQTHVFRPTDNSCSSEENLVGFRGSIIVTEAGGQKITGVVKYEMHQTDLATSKIDGMTVYRSMGQ